jgi:hypothetical protein
MEKFLPYFLVASTRKDDPLAVCHPLFDKDFLPGLFFDDFISFTLFTPLGKLILRPQSHDLCARHLPFFFLQSLTDTFAVRTLHSRSRVSPRG